MKYLNNTFIAVGLFFCAQSFGAEEVATTKKPDALFECRSIILKTHSKRGIIGYISDPTFSTVRASLKESEKASRKLAKLKYDELIKTQKEEASKVPSQEIQLGYFLNYSIETYCDDLGLIKP